MSYIAYAWFTTIAYGLGSVIGKMATKYHVSNPWLFNIVWAMLTVVFILPFALFAHVGMPQDWGSMFLLGIASAVSSVTFTFAFYEVDLSILSPLSNLRAPMVALVGVLVFHELLSSLQWLLIGVLFLAGLFLHVDERMSMKGVWSKGTGLAVLWIMTSVWFNTMIKIASRNNGFWEISLWSNLLMVLFLLPSIPFFMKDLRKTPVKRYYGIAVTTLFYTAGLLFSIQALSANVSISMAIISVPFAMLFTMVLAFVAPKLLEKHPLKVYAVRFAAAAVMFAAALGLSG